MQGRDAIYDQLEELEERFEEAAKNLDLDDQSKCIIMAQALQRMMQIVWDAYQTNLALGIDLADFVTDFLKRQDLAPAYMAIAFSSVSGLEKQSLEMMLTTADDYLAPKTSDVIAIRELGFA